MHGSRRLDYRSRVAALPPGGPQATTRALGKLDGASAVILVEGFSDQLAVETLAARLGRDLAAERTTVVPIGGAHALSQLLARVRDEAPHARLAGLCDAREEPIFRRAGEAAQLDVFVCDADLEDELIRALGAGAVEAVLEAQGDLDAFRTFQRQPAWRGRPTERQLRRFMGSAGRRKLRYARLLVDALDLDAVPRPLAGVLEL